MNHQKGESNVVDDCCCSDNSVDAGSGDRLYDGFVYPHLTGHCHHRRASQGHSGKETVVTIWIHSKHLTLNYGEE